MSSLCSWGLINSFYLNLSLFTLVANSSGIPKELNSEIREVVYYIKKDGSTDYTTNLTKITEISILT